MVKADFKGNTILESLDTLFESGYDPNVKIKKPFNRYYNVATIKDLEDLGLDISSSDDLEEFIKEDPCYNEIDLVGYAVAKDKYFDTFSYDAIEFAHVDRDGNLYQDVDGRCFDISLDDISRAIDNYSGEDEFDESEHTKIKEDDFDDDDFDDTIIEVIDDVVEELGPDYDYEQDGECGDYTNTFYKGDQVVAKISDDELVDLDRDDMKKYIINKVRGIKEEEEKLTCPSCGYSDVESKFDVDDELDDPYSTVYICPKCYANFDNDEIDAEGTDLLDD